MSGKIKSLIKDGRNVIGKKDPSSAVEVTLQLTGAGIVINHAVIEFDPESRQAMIYPNQEDP